MNRIDFDAMAEKVRNWGRWGKDDGRGTLNHIDPAALMRATATVSAGKTFSLGMRFDRNGPQLQQNGRINPQLYMVAIDKMLNPQRPASRFNDDVVHMSLQCATQWDALSHVHYDGELYNGHKVCEVFGPQGTTANGVEHLANPGILSRGVLLDIARLRGVDMLSGADGITPDDLNKALESHGLTIEPGDIVIVRTGTLRRMTVDNDRDEFNMHNPGLTPACAEWLHDKSAAAVACDNQAVECIDMEAFMGEMPLPLHQLCIRNMGMPLGEMWDLEALAADCASDRKYTFLVCAPPLAITGAVGSPVNPIALK